MKGFYDHLGQNPWKKQSEVRIGFSNIRSLKGCAEYLKDPEGGCCCCRLFIFSTNSIGITVSKIFEKSPGVILDDR